VLRFGSEGYLHRSLKHTRSADAVDIADAATKGAGDLAEIRSQSSVWLTECRCIGHVKGIEAGFERGLAEDREALEERHVVREIAGATELVALRVPKCAWIGVAGRVGDAGCGRRKRSWIEPGNSRTAAAGDAMRDLVRGSLIDRLGGSRRRTGCLNRKR